ncbi:hypothetical protein FRC08_003033 [Ceratobasidium sp. 394]|nr:hypothetical protein FRC08_003033 [Ceratobasidium sp. 394]KAG9080405.1 hypothetical protein FS749_008015 [Ceratobasidium sp. UAMH 11750]
MYVVLKSSVESERRIRTNLAGEKEKAKEKARAKANGKGKAAASPSVSPANASVDSISMDMSKFTISYENPECLSRVHDFNDANDISTNLGIAEVPRPFFMLFLAQLHSLSLPSPPVPVPDRAPAVTPSCALSSALSRDPSQAPISTLARDPAPAVANTPTSTSAISTPGQAGDPTVALAHESTGILRISAEFHDRIPQEILALLSGLAPTSIPLAAPTSGSKKAAEPAAAAAQPNPRPKPKAKQPESEPEPTSRDDDSSELSVSESNPPVPSESEAEGDDGSQQAQGSGAKGAKGAKDGTGEQQVNKPACARGSKTKAQTTTKATTAERAPAPKMKTKAEGTAK